jgi:hypothetical protein
MPHAVVGLSGAQRISSAARGAVKAQSTNAETPKAMARNSTILPRNTATPKGMTDMSSCVDERGRPV